MGGYEVVAEVGDRGGGLAPEARDTFSVGFGRARNVGCRVGFASRNPSALFSHLFGLTGCSAYGTKAINGVMESTRNDPQGGLITPDAQAALRGFFILGALHRVA